MTHAYIQDAGKHVGEEVTFRGWVHNKRSSGKIQFVIVRDGTGYIQGVVAKSAVSPEIFAAADSLTHESSIEVTGKVRADARAPSGFEMDVTDLKVVQEVSKDQPFPITPKEHGIEFLMDQRHLWIRSTRQRAILKIRHEIIKAVRDFLDDDGFTLCDT
ncbi:MAG: asparagine--tRNA ligase, partial [Acidobacteria bacterium]|nr:asparagine--tRNA ligase [Acidobacteriota bacterium]